ncbi:HNH endonuclease signature motif containing protein [Phytomonospora endophytica]|uniref:HNH nuclease domain-containing protein n=1 Tax=Phytomonospora endophytica TaxID=714109 RepID=A0A841FDJ7_9ACTN|nr:HNH endonuclease signature motif containing protein [Phytomonospora endophytica]MBB6035351.1 hypothetical protein [Phytomonospora endophytica]GIG63897.1 hypothetical protein Pen01_01920 [Phytomonospora endophytica]
MFVDSPELTNNVLNLLGDVRRTEGRILQHLASIHAQGGLASAGWNGSLAGWLIAKAGLAKYRAQLWQQAATHLEFLPATAYAVTTGAISIDQAAPVFRAVARGHRAALTDKFDEPIPSDYVPGRPLWTLDELFAELAQHEPVQTVNQAVKEFLNRVDAERQARDFERLQERRHVLFTPTLDGSWHLEGLLDPLAGASVQTALDSLMTPEGSTDQRSTGQRRADALRDLAETGTGANGRGVTTVVVTVDNLALTTDVTKLPSAGVAERRLTRPWADLEGAPLPVPIARKLACDARIIPAVLDSDGRVLDVGRAKRLVTTGLRQALAIEQPTCMFPRCTVSWRRADAHHIVPWAEGGRTDLDNLVHVCGRHHDAAHSANWTVHRDPDDGSIVWTGTAGEVHREPLQGRAVEARRRLAARAKADRSRITMPDILGDLEVPTDEVEAPETMVAAAASPDPGSAPKVTPDNELDPTSESGTRPRPETFAGPAMPADDSTESTSPACAVPSSKSRRKAGSKPHGKSSRPQGGQTRRQRPRQARNYRRQSGKQR